MAIGSDGVVNQILVTHAGVEGLVDLVQEGDLSMLTVTNAQAMVDIRRRFDNISGDMYAYVLILRGGGICSATGSLEVPF